MATHKPKSRTSPTLPIMSFAADEVAMAALGAQRTAPPRCDLCGRRVQDEGAPSGLLMWSRGDELRFDQPPLCPRCAERIGVTAFARWTAELDEG